MISKKCSESDVKMMFAPFGSIEDCTILRDQNGQSRGTVLSGWIKRLHTIKQSQNMIANSVVFGCLLINSG